MSSPSRASMAFRRDRRGQPCRTPSCNRTIKAKGAWLGLCMKCGQAHRRHGHVLATVVRVCGASTLPQAGQRGPRKEPRHRLERPALTLGRCRGVLPTRSQSNGPPHQAPSACCGAPRGDCRGRGHRPPDRPDGCALHAPSKPNRRGSGPTSSSTSPLDTSFGGKPTRAERSRTAPPEGRRRPTIGNTLGRPAAASAS